MAKQHAYYDYRWVNSSPLDKIMAAILQTIFQMNVREWKVLYFDLNFKKFVSIY